MTYVLEIFCSVVCVLLNMPGAFINTLTLIHCIQKLKGSHGALRFALLAAICQSCIDIFIILSFILAALTSTLPLSVYENAGTVVCFLQSYALWWFFSTLRAIMNACIASYKFIKLLFPFDKSGMSTPKMLGIIGGMAFTICSLACFVRIIIFNFDSKTNRCSSILNDQDHEDKQFVMIARIISLVTFTEGYAVPYISLLYFYRKIIHNLMKDQDDMNKQIIIEDLCMNYYLDGVMGLLFEAIIQIPAFLYQFCAFRPFQFESRLHILFAYFVATMYATIYVIISIRSRRIYLQTKMFILNWIPYINKLHVELPKHIKWFETFMKKRNPFRI